MKKSTSFSKKLAITMSLVIGLMLNMVNAENKANDKNEAIKAKVLGIIHKVFKDSDSNNDGRMNKNELVVLNGELKKFYMKMLTLVSEDSDGNREVREPPIKEVHAHVDNLIKGMDMNNDAELNRPECTALKNEVEKMVTQP